MKKPSQDELRRIESLLGTMLSMKLMDMDAVDLLVKITLHFEENHGLDITEATKLSTGIAVKCLRMIADQMEKNTTDHHRQMLVQAGLVDAAETDYPSVDIKALHDLPGEEPK